jgi:hypothetical protein
VLVDVFKVFRTYPSQRRHRKKGSILAEFPAAMYVIFFGMLLPLIGLTVIGYRVACVYFAVRDSCYKAAKSGTFGSLLIPNSAVYNANAAWTTDTAAWSGIATNSTETIYIVTHPINGSAETVQAVKLAAPPNTTLNMYFIRLTASAQIQPFFYSSSWMGLGAVPGLNAPFPLTITYQYYAENPTGLTQ